MANSRARAASNRSDRLSLREGKFDAERYKRIRAIAAAIIASGSGTEVEQVLQLFSQEIGYATPKVDVRGVVFRDGCVMLVREISDGKRTLPGGWADVNQSASECVKRETEEESGFQVRVTKLAAVWDYRRHGHVSRHPHSIASGAATVAAGRRFFVEL